MAKPVPRTYWENWEFLCDRPGRSILFLRSGLRYGTDGSHVNANPVVTEANAQSRTWDHVQSLKRRMMRIG